MSGIAKQGVSKQVANCVKVTEPVVQAFEVHGDEVIDGVVMALEASEIPGLPSRSEIAAVILAMHQMLGGSVDALKVADQRHGEELADDPPFREERDAALSDLQALIEETKDAVRSRHGLAGLKKVGLEGARPGTHRELAGYANKVASLLLSATLGEARNKRVQIDLKGMAEDLQTAVTRLETALGDVEREKREANQTRADRDNRLAHWSYLYGAVTRIYEGFARLAKREDIADRIKTTPKRRAGKPEPEDNTNADNTNADNTNADNTNANA